MQDVSKLTTERESTDPFVEPLSVLASELGRIAAEIQAVECSHLEKMEAAAAELRSRFRDQMAGELRKQVECEFQTEIQTMRADFEEAMRSATVEWEAQHQSLLKEVEELRKPSDRRSDRRALEMELAQTGTALAELQRDIQTLLEDSNGDLSQIMRKNARCVELQAYIKGLTFKAGTT